MHDLSYDTTGTSSFDEVPVVILTQVQSGPNRVFKSYRVLASNLAASLLAHGFLVLGLIFFDTRPWGYAPLPVAHMPHTVEVTLLTASSFPQKERTALIKEVGKPSKTTKPIAKIASLLPKTVQQETLKKHDRETHKIAAYQALTAMKSVDPIDSVKQEEKPHEHKGMASFISASPAGGKISSAQDFSNSFKLEKTERSGKDGLSLALHGSGVSSKANQLASSTSQAWVNPPPTYPALSRKLGESGRVVVRVLVGVNGEAQKAEVLVSSGFNRLDQASILKAELWRYQPAKKDGKSVDSWLDVPFEFILNQAVDYP